MLVPPLVRYMLACDDVQVDPANEHKLNIQGLIHNISSPDQAPYPLLQEKLCVFLALTDGYDAGKGKIVCVSEESGNVIFETGERTISFNPSPLAIQGVLFRLQDCLFPETGVYLLQFWFEGERIAECPLRLR